MDIGFTRFITNTWISFIWFLVIVVHFLGALGAMFYAFSIDGGAGLLSLLVVPLTLLSLLFSRMALELDVVMFRIETNTRETKEYLRAIEMRLRESQEIREPQESRKKYREGGGNDMDVSIDFLQEP